jgi:hypothetical protein
MRRKLFEVNGSGAGAAGSSSMWMVVVLDRRVMRRKLFEVNGGGDGAAESSVDKEADVTEAVRGERWWCWSCGKQFKVDGGGIGQGVMRRKLFEVNGGGAGAA